MRKRRKKGTFSGLQRMLLVFYAVMLLIPAATCTAAYVQSVHFVTEQEMQTRTKLAQDSLNKMEDTLLSADRYTDSIMGMRQFENWLRTDGSMRNVLTSRIYTFLANFPTLGSSDYVKRCYIYSAVSDSILEKTSGYLDLSLYYEKLFRIEGYDLSAWRTEILNDRSAYRFFAADDTGSSGEVIYSKRISYQGRQGRIVFFLDLKKLADAQWITEAYENGFIAVYAGEDSLLYTNSSRPFPDRIRTGTGHGGYTVEKLNGQEMVFCSVSLPSYGWTMILAAPKNLFTQQALRVSWGILRGLIPLLAVSTLLVLLLLKASRKPMINTINTLPRQGEQHTLNPFRYVQDQVKLLSEANARQRSQLLKSQEELREAAIDSLVYQRGRPEEEIRNQLYEAGIRFDGESFRALVMVLFDNAGKPKMITDRMHLVLMELAEEFASKLVYLKMDAPDRLLFLALTADEAPLRETLTALGRNISAALDCEVKFYASGGCQNVEGMSRAFHTAMHMASYHPIGESCAVFAPAEERMPVYEFSDDDVRMLRSLAGSGSREALVGCLRDIRDRNSGVHVRTAFEYQLLYAHMIDALLAAGYSGALDEKITQHLSDIGTAEFFQIMENCWTALCEQNSSSGEMEKRKLTERILEDLENRFSDYDLTMAREAQKFGLSDRKLSALVREATGLNFPDYLEKLRIDRAIELLRDHAKTIDDIALAVGYASDKSFRRAFKRIMGQSPSSFR